MSLLTRLVETLRTQQALARGSRYIVACSGGADSIALSHLCAALAARWDARITLAYIHHGLRPEADAEQEFVAAFAAEHGLAFAARSVDVRSAHAPGSSLQDTARRLRYAALEGIRAEAGAEWILTAHHADDQAETLLLRFLTGAGPDGLAGIRRRNGRILRPLLDFTRAELREYAETAGLAWMEDASNVDPGYRRNALRMHVLPEVLRHVNPGVVHTLAASADIYSSMADWLRERSALLAGQCMTASETGLSLAVQSLVGYFEFERLMVIRHALALLAERRWQGEDVWAVHRLLFENQGAHMQIGGGVTAYREQDAVLLLLEEDPEPEEMRVRLGETVAFGRGVFSSVAVPVGDVRFERDPSVEWIDLDSAGSEWTLRRFRAGDRIHPLGLGSDTPVSDVLRDARIPQRLRRTAAVLDSASGIIWVCGVRLDMHARITDSTTRAARLLYRTHEEQ